MAQGRLSGRTGITAIVLGCMLAGIVATAGYWLRSTLPNYDAALVMRGLRADVRVVRDDMAVPHIFADNLRDAHMALGYVHAQDRLWQMESMRRLGRGRLAEIIGPAGLGSDRLMRMFGFSQLVETQFEALEPDTRAALEAYARGVNAAIADNEQVLPPEFALFNIRPEPWLPSDSLIWGRIMSMRLSGNWRDELVRARMLETLSNEQILRFWYPDMSGANADQAALESRALQRTYGTLPLGQLAALAPPLPSAPRGASNAWAVAGPQSETGKPVLANDPHLGFGLPALWYLARIETPELSLSGATVPGVPFMILGHNDNIAWGFTATQSDQQDVFIERLSEDRKSYRVPGGALAAIEQRQETISVRGRADEVMSVRTTRHGPVVSDLVEAFDPGTGSVLALSAVFLNPHDSTPDAMLRMNRATNWETFRDALSGFQSPQLNLVYADASGDIGFAAPGLVPIRGAGRGRFPVPGWDGVADWNGFVAFDALPMVHNPPAGRVVSANNKIVSDDYPHFISDDWAAPYRSQRIFRLLDVLAPHSIASTADIQLDIISEMARELLPLMSTIAPRDPDVASALNTLVHWDGVMSKNAHEPLLFYAWLRAFNRALYADETGPVFGDVKGLRPRFVATVLRDHRAWCDNIETQVRESCEDILVQSLSDALTQLAAMQPNGDSAGYATGLWGDAHRAMFRNPVWASVPLVEQIFGNRNVAADGGNYTLNRAAVRVGDDKAPFADIHGAGYRAIYDLADLKRSRYIITTGQSGNPLSSHYDDFLPLWSGGKYVNLGAPRAELERNGAAITLLLPKPMAGMSEQSPDDKSFAPARLAEQAVHGVIALVREWAP